jgi:hypothetical protein
VISELSFANQKYCSANERNARLLAGPSAEAFAFSPTYASSHAHLCGGDLRNMHINTAFEWHRLRFTPPRWRIFANMEVLSAQRHRAPGSFKMNGHLPNGFAGVGFDGLRKLGAHE